MTALYTAAVAAMGDGRNGRIQSTDGHLDAQVRVPHDLGGPGGATTLSSSGGYAACFDSALKLLAKAHSICPYSNATRGNVEVSLAIA
ncbi:hypothetical protein SPF06_00720 [Sinomonas sp. JGH33]|uniref:Organic hydroperoxide resistance protein n=1 Tax=Sinomonas terricola TaxID=3110330 RepID=A0ABU5T0Q3_9MICC|nr:hypothetical protein [Sinomonas sp. JGH33]MEA5453232.1 hypothetical protein [Sinomonas sp. JGH33]